MRCLCLRCVVCVRRGNKLNNEYIFGFLSENIFARRFQWYKIRTYTSVYNSQDIWILWAKSVAYIWAGKGSKYMYIDCLLVQVLEEIMFTQLITVSRFLDIRSFLWKIMNLQHSSFHMLLSACRYELSSTHSVS